MSLTFDSACQAAIDLAKRCLPGNAKLDIGLLMGALYHSTDLKTKYPFLEKHLPPPKPIREDLPTVRLSEELMPLFNRLPEGHPVCAEELFTLATNCDSGRKYLLSLGVAEEELASLLTPSTVEKDPTVWRGSLERQKAIGALDSYGRILTASEPPHKGVAGMEDSLVKLYGALVKLGRKNVIIHGPPGCGKTALVYEFARQIFHKEESLPHLLRDRDIFELSPSFLRSGASVVGQYEARVKSLIEVLQANPRIILFIDEIHSFFQSGLHERGPFSDANESFKSYLGHSETSCIGCTTTAEYRHHIEPDGALARRFEVIKLGPPSRETTLAILKARLPRLREHYDPLIIPDSIIKLVADVTDEYLPGRYQPDKSIQLLDRSCATALLARPPATEVTKEYVLQALVATTGRSIYTAEQLREDSVYQQLRKKILGQDETLKEISHAFIAGLGNWKGNKGPRGSFVFFGPTGVGKTQTARELARILGGGEEALIRIDCNTLMGSGHDSGPVINRLIGSPPGYVGYVRGQGGILSRIRDMPECVVMFDEIEKADPGIGKILLQVLDEGRVEDSQGNLLDFRRSFLMFTTNAGCVYDHREKIGFAPLGNKQPSAKSPYASVDSVLADLRARGFGEEFLGRHLRFFLFRNLTGKVVNSIIANKLEWLRDTAELKGYRLKWENEIIPHLASQWQPRFGVRHLTTILRNRIIEQLSVAEAQSELSGVEEIFLKIMFERSSVEVQDLAGYAQRRREGSVLVIEVA